jgi:hypothetical protein
MMDEHTTITCLGCGQVFPFDDRYDHVCPPMPDDDMEMSRAEFDVALRAAVLAERRRVVEKCAEIADEIAAEQRRKLLTVAAEACARIAFHIRTIEAGGETTGGDEDEK